MNAEYIVSFKLNELINCANFCLSDNYSIKISPVKVDKYGFSSNGEYLGITENIYSIILMEGCSIVKLLNINFDSYRTLRSICKQMIDKFNQNNKCVKVKLSR